MSFLLSVDFGLKTGLALYGRDGRLIWYRSQNYASIKRLKSAVYGIFNETPNISRLVIEGGGSLAEIWIKEAKRRNIALYQISAETYLSLFNHYSFNQFPYIKASNKSLTLSNSICIFSTSD